MLIYAVALFAVAALFGVYMLTRVLGGALPPWPAAILHGLLAATGLLLLLYVAFLTGAPAPQPVVIAAVLFVIAALGGFLALSFHLRKQPIPKALGLIHGLVAVCGFLVLCASVFNFI